MKTHHSVYVKCSADDAFALCLNVKKWPEIFPPCIDSDILKETSNSQVISLTARANDQLFSWESTRYIDRKNRTIEFSQSKPIKLVEYMNGKWQIEPKGIDCEIILSHEFNVHDEVAGLIKEVTTQEEAVSFMLRTIEENSYKELNSLKNELESTQWQHEFNESLIIPHPKSTIFQLLRDVSLWTWLLPHCTNIQIIYEDGKYQEFEMEVKVSDKTEIIRSIRILDKDCIEYFQPAPPPALNIHQGKWTVEEVQGGVRVISYHKVVLNKNYWENETIESAKLKVETAINKNSLATMQAITQKLREN